MSLQLKLSFLFFCAVITERCQPISNSERQEMSIIFKESPTNFTFQIIWKLELSFSCCTMAARRSFWSFGFFKKLHQIIITTTSKNRSRVSWIIVKTFKDQASIVFQTPDYGRIQDYFNCQIKSFQTSNISRNFSQCLKRASVICKFGVLT